MPGRRLLMVFAAWSVLVWAGRIDNVLSDPDLSAGGQAARLTLALSFVASGMAVGVLAVRGRPLTERGRMLVRATAAWTVGVWLVRGGQIAFGSHSGGFIVVHLVLGAVSIGLALVALRATQAAPRPSSVAS